MVGITTLAELVCILTRSSEGWAIAVEISNCDDRSVPAVSQTPPEARCISSSRYVVVDGGQPHGVSAEVRQSDWEEAHSAASPGPVLYCCSTAARGATLTDPHPPNRGCPPKPTVSLCRALQPANHGIANALRRRNDALRQQVIPALVAAVLLIVAFAAHAGAQATNSLALQQLAEGDYVHLG